MFQPLKRATIYEEIVSNIRGMIDQGRLNAGERLPSERVLSEAFRVSRPSVRKALKTLKHQGYLEKGNGTGICVSHRTADQFAERIAAAILNEKEYQVQILEMRRLVEPGIAALAAQRATKDETMRMESILLLQKERVDMGETGSYLDRIFHYIIAQTAKNRAIMHLVETAEDLFSENRRRYLQTADRPQKSVRHHMAILNAIVAGNSRAAAEVMHEHLTDIHETLFAEG